MLALTPAGCSEHQDVESTGDQLASGELLPESVRRRLDESGWQDRAGDRLGLWVSAARQRLVGIENGRVRFVYPCSTAKRGIGNKEGSYRTPAGWHAIDERFGDGLPWGAVFKERKYTGRSWDRANPTADDLILSRILWLSGLEPGVNSGPGVDSHARYIYIHGTPEEHLLGTPASHGCVRLSNDDVMTLYDACPTGTPVLITEW